MRAIEQRLARIEQAVSPPEAMHVWAGAETLADTIARQFPEGVPNGVTIRPDSDRPNRHTEWTE